jgi:hypothetical protein
MKPATAAPASLADEGVAAVKERANASAAAPPNETSLFMYPSLGKRVFGI